MSDNLPGKVERADRYFHYMDEKGNLHKVDLLTGNIVQSAPEFEQGLVPGKSFSPEFIKGNTRFYEYSPIYKDLVSQMIAEGKSLTQIASKPGFPSLSIFAKWRSEHPEFEEAIMHARRARAEVYADRIADTLDETREISKEEVPAEKLYFDKLKYLAEKNDPKTYGNAKEEAGKAPITMVINTGVPLEDEGPVTIEVNNETGAEGQGTNG